MRTRNLAWNLQPIGQGEINMLDEKRMHLRLVADNSKSTAPLADMVAFYAEEIDERRRQLSDDLEYFKAKLTDLDQLDPLDFTGLGKMYRDHASHIRTLLASIDEKTIKPASATAD
jgi:hypothetical protein